MASGWVDRVREEFPQGPEPLGPGPRPAPVAGPPRRAADRYIERASYHYIASITYFSLLLLVPLLMVASSVAGFALASQPHLLDTMVHEIVSTLPGGLGDKATKLLTGFVEQRTSVGCSAWSSASTRAGTG